MKRRDFLKYSAATAGVAALTQVTGSRFAAAAEQAASSKVALSLILNFSTFDANIVTKVVKRFEKANPGITVSIENLAADFYTKINTLGVSHTLPDVWYVRTYDVAYDALKGWVEPLNGYIAKTPGFDLGDFFPSVRSQIAYKGKIYTLPWNLSDMVIFINKALFKEAGVAVPSPNWTWDDFASTASKLAAKIRLPQFACDVSGFVTSGYFTLEGVLEGNGGSLLSSNFEHATTTKPQNIKLLNFFAELHTKGYMPTTGAFPAGVDPFVAGLEAMSAGGSWLIASYPSSIGNHFDWEVLPVPIGTTGKRGVSLAGGGFGVASTSRNKEAAFMLADWLTNTSSLNYAVSDYLNSLPARQSSMPAYLKTAKDMKFAPHGIDYVEEETKTAIPTNWPPYMSPLNTAIGNRIPPIFTGASVTTQLSLLGRDIEPLIKQYYA